MVASEPMPISISPSPVTTSTPRFGCATASPKPIIAACHLPRIELALLAAPGDDHDEREAAYLDHAEYVDEVADAARLHEQYRLLAAEPGTRDEADAFFLAGERHRAHALVGLAQLDQ